MVADMANYYAQVALASVTGESADVNVNTFAVTGPAVFTPTQGEFWTDAIKAFYDELQQASALLGRATTGHVVKMYAATLATPNYPIDENGFNLAFAPAGVELPLEVSLCISYANDSATIVPRARRRGRIYIPGFGEGQNAGGRPNSTIIGALADAYETYIDTINADSDWTACVWSRVNSSLYPIERLWVDDEWDTVRSRGGKATTRQTRLIT